MGQIVVRLDDEEEARVAAVMRKIEEREGKYPKVTQKLVFIRALERLEAYLDKLEKERKKD